MKKTIASIILSFLSILAWSQNRINHSQYMHNQSLFNPAYVKSDYLLNTSLFFHKQWTGFEGAPTTTSLLLDYQLKQKHGLKLNFYKDQITVFSDTKIGLGYNYVGLLAEKTLISFGIMLDYGTLNGQLSTLSPSESNDPVFEQNMLQSYLNIGSGIYIESEKFQFGFSLPYLFNNQQKTTTNTLDGDVTFNHIYSTIGAYFGDEYLAFYPSSLVKFVAGSPLQIDLNLQIELNKKIWGGLGVRSDQTLLFFAGGAFLKELKVIYSYEFVGLTTSKFGSGSHEFSLSYGINLHDDDPFRKRKYFRKSGARKNI